jgi:hypothetical protein
MNDKISLPGLPRANGRVIRQNRCETCGYAERPNPSTQALECHAGPPGVGIIMMARPGRPPQPEPVAAFPPVRPEQWCGQWKPKVGMLS